MRCARPAHSPLCCNQDQGDSRRHQSCRGEGGTTAGEILKPIMWPIIRSTPDARPGTAPDEKTEMRYPTRASEPVHRRLWVPPSPLHDPSAQELHDESSWGWETVRCVLDWGHQNGMDRLVGAASGRCCASGNMTTSLSLPKNDPEQTVFVCSYGCNISRPIDIFRR